MPCSDRRSQEGHDPHDEAEPKIINRQWLLAPASDDAEHDDEEADDRVRSGRGSDRQPQDVEQDRDAELSTANADQPRRRADDDSRKNPSIPFRAIAGSTP